jgi:hypothetical protein
MDIKPGDILFVWGTSFVDRGIELVTHGPSHVAMFVNENTVCEAQGGRTVGETALSFYDSDTIEVWRDMTLTDDDRQSMLTFAKQLYGTPYDYALLPLAGLSAEFGISDAWYHENGRFICSTFVANVAEHVGRHWARGVNPVPVDLQTSGELTKIYTRDGASVWVT